MDSIHGATRYRIVGLSVPDGWGLLIDYVEDDARADPARLVDLVRDAPDLALSGLPLRTRLNEDDLFEIENVSGLSAATEAVAFWRAYFRSLGRSISEGPLGSLFVQVV